MDVPAPPDGFTPVTAAPPDPPPGFAPVARTAPPPPPGFAKPAVSTAPPPPPGFKAVTPAPPPGFKPVAQTESFMDTMKKIPERFTAVTQRVHDAGRQQIDEALAGPNKDQYGNVEADDLGTAVMRPLKLIGGGLDEVAAPIAGVLGSTGLDPDLSKDIAELPAMIPLGEERVAAALPGMAEKSSVHDIESAAIKHPETGEILKGDSHPEIAVEHKLPGDPQDWHTERKQSGFALKDGTFIDRDEALKRYGVDTSEDVKAAQEKVPDAKPSVEKVSDDLFANSNANTADKLEMTQRLKTIKDIPEATFTKLQQYEESGGKIPLLPAEQALYDRFFKPIAEESDEHVKYIKEHGGSDLDLAEDGYTPRQVKGSGGPVDRLLQAGKKAVKGVGKSLSTFAPATQGRSFFAVDTPQGRKVVYANEGGELFDAADKGSPIGHVPEGKPYAGADISMDGKTGKLQNATIAEIEKATQGRVQYHKNLLATRVTNLMNLRRARRNIEMIEQWKKDPNFSELMRWPKSNAEVPGGFRHVNSPYLPAEFKGAFFHPEIAEALEDFLPKIKNDPVLDRIEKVGNFAKASMFFNPIKHMGNVSYQYLMSKGLVGTALHLPSTTKHLYEAFRAVATQNKEYMRYLKEGASLPYSKQVAEQFPAELLRAMGDAAAKDPQSMLQIAKKFGYASTAGMIKAVYAVSAKALWSYGDMLTIARIKDLEKAGMTTKEAIKEAERIVPSYRVPSRVMGSRLVSQAIQNPLTGMYGRYDYNRLRSFAEVWKSVKDPAQRMKGLDQAAFVAFMATIGYGTLDALAQKVTGNKDASVERSGAGKLVQTGEDLATGNKNMRQAAMSAFSPGVLAAPAEAALNTNFYTGQPIFQEDDVRHGKFGRAAFDEGKFLAGQLSPVNNAMQMGDGKTDIYRFLEGQAMINNPTQAQVAGRKVGQVMNTKAEAKATKKRPKWAN